MSDLPFRQTIFNLLDNLKGLAPLKQLFWTELNYDRANQTLSRREWPEAANTALAEDPVLFATEGEQDAFHILYCRLKESNKLPLTKERPVINRLIQDHPNALFVFSDSTQYHWHFVNVKDAQSKDKKKRRVLRRISIGPEDRLRTATERIALLDLDKIPADMFGLPVLEIQKRHDEAFDVEKVTKDFYREIANWYFWALKHIRFPKDAPKEKDGLDHVSVIRLITRLIFCWFIREKGLIPEPLFGERELRCLLIGFEPTNPANQESVFYRAILQNLFFATLNTDMNERDWARDKQNYMAHTRYRFRECFHAPGTALDIFRNIPFLNGGLFECLDKNLGEGGASRVLRIDGFSRRADSQVTAPDFLFFGPEQEVDLSVDYGNKKFRKARVRGLIKTLNRYKFTIEENTPFDQEVALDPELCGKIFENLLAAYNPETGTTARKATGSFYTPREIVDYMVDEALIAFLRKGNDEAYEEKLRKLFSWSETEHDFSEDDKAGLIDRIDSLKALDPAVGSGAFPMGILHKLVFILGKLDPGNARWKAKQIDKMDDVGMREDAERIFRENYDNYGRKLYLIENCIYGVDIQPIAVQIAKMRFFISLIVDQKVDRDKPNLGVRALPNLETKFVAANTLIGIEKPKQLLFRSPVIDAKEAELRKVREKHFNAKTPKSKNRCRELDKQLRAEIAKLLEKDGWGHETAKRLAAWDPYDQNTSADFFDPEWMFGLRDGFDVVIGNPPYLESRHPGFSDTLKTSLQKEVRILWGDDSRFITRGADLLIYFFEVSLLFINSTGNVVFITQNAWLNTEYGKKFQLFLLKKTFVRAIIDSDFKYFDDGEGPNINTVISIFEGNQPTDNKITFARVHEDLAVTNFNPLELELRSNEDNAAIHQYPYNHHLISTIKWGILLAAPEDFFQLLERLKAKACEINKIQGQHLSVGQGLNLTKNFFVSYDIVKEMGIKQSAVIPIFTSNDGAPFVCSNTSNVLLNRNNFGEDEKKNLQNHNFSLFNPDSTSKPRPILILPRGLGRHFCSFNEAGCYSSSGVDVYDPNGIASEEVRLNLWASLNSSVCWLYRELSGRKNLGGGMLKAEAVDLEDLPIYMNFNSRRDIKLIFEKLKKRHALETIAEIHTDEHLHLDMLVFEYLGFSSSFGENIRSILIKIINDRLKKSKT